MMLSPYLSRLKSDIVRAERLALPFTRAGLLFVTRSDGKQTSGLKRKIGDRDPTPTSMADIFPLPALRRLYLAYCIEIISFTSML